MAWDLGSFEWGEKGAGGSGILGAVVLGGLGLLIGGTVGGWLFVGAVIALGLGIYGLVNE